MKKKPVFKLNETEALAHFEQYVHECDADEVARLLGDFFGGVCFCKPKKVKRAHYLEFVNIYEFEPNEFYAGEFGEIETD
jgi:hypothetical protein